MHTWYIEHQGEYKIHYKKNKKKILKRQRKINLRLKYGLTLKQFADMVKKQNGLCLICKKPQIDKKKLCVDHDHKTGKIRGLLCDHCNKGLGHVREDIKILEAMVKYLKKHENIKDM